MSVAIASFGKFITWYLIGGLLGGFVILEIIALATGRETMSQYVIRRAREGSRLYLAIAVGFPVLVILIGIWLTLHWYSWCFAFGWFCEVHV